MVRRALLLALLLDGLARAQAPRESSQAERAIGRAPQLVIVLTDGWDATRGTLHLVDRRHTKAPTQAPMPAFPVDIGHGLAWGRGLHPAPPAGLGGPEKREGDGRSPAGVFALTEVTGYDERPPAGTRLPYRRADADLYCVDDVHAREYNRLARRTPATTWSSTEPMRRPDGLYQLTVFVAHNEGGLPGAGSCIFLHVSQNQPTVGCTSMPLPSLQRLVAWLEPGAVLVQLPRDVYQQLAPAWRLPPRD